jgi:hypothetical protein
MLQVFFCSSVKKELIPLFAIITVYFWSSETCVLIDCDQLAPRRPSQGLSRAVGWQNMSLRSDARVIKQPTTLDDNTFIYYAINDMEE